MLNGTPSQRKGLLKELIVQVRVESRDSIIPTFRLFPRPRSTHRWRANYPHAKRVAKGSSGHRMRW